MSTCIFFTGTGTVQITITMTVFADAFVSPLSFNQEHTLHTARHEPSYCKRVGKSVCVCACVRVCVCVCVCERMHALCLCEHTVTFQP